MVLGAKGSHLIEACVLDMSGGGLKLRASSPVPCGTPIKIDSKNTLMLGEVCRCEPEGEAYTAAVQLCHTLSSLMDLELLNRALIGEGRGQKVESASDSPVSRR